MPDPTITLTANQAQRLAAALHVSTLAEATAAVKALLKERVKKHEAMVDSNAAYDAANLKADTDFAGF
jgi:hypothetical protein